MRLLARLLAAVLSPKDIIFSLGADKLTLYRFGSRRTEKILQQAVGLPARILLPMPPPRQVPFWEGAAPNEGTPRVSRKLRGARARRTRRQNWADCGPPLEEHPPDECAEFCLTASSISRRSEISYRSPDLASDRERGR